MMDSGPEPPPIEASQPIVHTNVVPTNVVSKNVTPILARPIDDPDALLEPRRIIQRVKDKFKNGESIISKLDTQWDAVDVGLSRTAFRRVRNKEAYWCPPKGLWECLYGMPYSQEICITVTGSIYYIDHSSQTVSTAHPLEVQAHNQDSKVAFEEKVVAVTLDSAAVSLSNYGIVIQKRSKSFVVESVSSVSPFSGNLLNGDILLEVGDIPLHEQDDVMSYFKNRGKVYIKLLRPVQQRKCNTLLRKKGPKKSSIRSESRRQFISAHPVSVHFCDRPVILQYVHETMANRWEDASIERNFLNVLKITYSTGMVKSFRFRRTQTISEMVAEALSKMTMPLVHYFTLALVPSGSADIQYFSPEQLVSSVLSEKKEKPEYECHLLLYTFPSDLQHWADKKHRPLINYLFHQTRNFLLMANMAWLSNISSGDLHQLIAMAATIDFMLSGLNQIDSALSSGDPAGLRNPSIGSNETALSPNNRTTQRPMPTVSEKATKKVRLSTFKLEQWTIFPPWATLKDIRRDLDQYHIISLMINCFNQVASNDIKIFYFGDVTIHSSFNVKVDPTFREKIDNVISKTQVTFIQAAIETRIIDCIRYRVHFCVSPTQPTSRKIRSIGAAGTVVLSHSKIELEDHGEMTEVMKIKDITAVIASYKDEDRYLITVVSSDIPNMLSFITPVNDFRSVFWIISAYATNICSPKNQRKVAILDITNREYRCEPRLTPSYKDLHLVLPSLWNYSSPPGLFFKRYLECASPQATTSDVVKLLLPWFMVFPTDSTEESTGSFGTTPLHVGSHLCFLPEGPFTRGVRDEDADLMSFASAASRKERLTSGGDHNESDDDTSQYLFHKGLMADEIEMIKNSETKVNDGIIRQKNKMASKAM